MSFGKALALALKTCLYDTSGFSSVLCEVFLMCLYFVLCVHCGGSLLALVGVSVSCKQRSKNELLEVKTAKSNRRRKQYSCLFIFGYKETVTHVF